MIRALAALLCVASLAPCLASAQLPAELARRRVVDVQIVGETSGATGAREVGIPVGAPITRQLLRDTVTRLVGTGRWADVQIDVVPRGADVALFVYLRPRILITRVDVVGNAVLSHDDITRAIGLSPNGALEQEDLGRLANAVADAYVEHGYADADVELELRDTDDPSRKVLRVLIDEREPLRVAAYEYDGDPPPDTFDVPGAIGIGVGAVLDRRRLREGVEEAAQHLREAGWLEATLSRPEIRREADGAHVRLSSRIGPHYDIVLRGYAPFARETVEGALQLSNERLTRATLGALRERVLELMRRHGFHDGTVDIERYRGEREGSAVLELVLHPGRQLHVVGMAFPGAQAYTSDYLRAEVVSVLEDELPDTRLFTPVDSDTLDRIGVSGGGARTERSRPRPLEVDPGRVYFEPAYEHAVQHLTELYEAQGYLSARVGPARLTPIGRGRAVVEIPVFEGPRTQLYAVALRGNELLGDRELLEAARLVRGAPFSYLALEEATEHMLELYQERGYLFARIEPNVRFSDDRERAEVTVRVIERFEVHIGQVYVEGHERTSEDLIRGLLRFASGDLYRPSALRASQDALMSLGIFTSVSVAPENPELPERVKNVTVTVRERMPIYFDGSLGISTGQGFRGAAELQFRNVGGYAIDVALRGQLGFQFFFQDPELERNITALTLNDRLERNFGASLSLPYIPGLYNVRTSLDITHIRDNQRAFGIDKDGFALSFNWRPETWLAFTLSGEIEYNDVQLFGNRTSIEEILNPPPGQPPPNPSVVRLLRVPQGKTWVASARLAGSIDQRDNAFVPTRGWSAAADAEWVRTLDVVGQTAGMEFFSNFVKLSLTANGYVPIGDVVLAAQVRIGGIVHLEPGSRSYPNRQFFLGGMDTLRGFNYQQLQPQDLADLQLADPSARTRTVLQGGEFMYLVRVEVRFPIFSSLHGAVFADLGNMWADPALVLLNENFVRPTAGLGLRIVTPVGPVALDYGFNILRREELGEPFGAFSFSIGVF